MARGGSRPGSGRPSVFKHTPTELIRVPSKYVEEILDFAHEIDRGPLYFDEIKVYKLHGRRVVRVNDLFELGWLPRLKRKIVVY